VNSLALAPQFPILSFYSVFSHAFGPKHLPPTLPASPFGTNNQQIWRRANKPTTVA
jgi:hypothetical protein